MNPNLATYRYTKNSRLEYIILKVIRPPETNHFRI